jgi:FAD binding domain-containing protein
VEAFVREAPQEMLRLEHWGCPWSREPDGHIAVRPFGGMKIERSWFAADKTGFHLLHTLFQTSLKYQAIRRYDEFFVTKFLVDNGRGRNDLPLPLAREDFDEGSSRRRFDGEGQRRRSSGRAFPSSPRDCARLVERVTPEIAERVDDRFHVERRVLR